jgi:hypothetical protein
MTFVSNQEIQGRLGETVHIPPPTVGRASGYADPHPALEALGLLQPQLPTPSSTGATFLGGFLYVL